MNSRGTLGGFQNIILSKLDKQLHGQYSSDQFCKLFLSKDLNVAKTWREIQVALFPPHLDFYFTLWTKNSLTQSDQS